MDATTIVHNWNALQDPYPHISVNTKLKNLGLSFWNVWDKTYLEKI